MNLMLDTSFCLMSACTVFVPFLRGILICLSRLDKFRYFYSFCSGLFLLIFESRVVGNVFLCDGLCRLNVNKHIAFHIESDRSLSPYALWQRLGHISLGRMKMLMKERILLLSQKV